MRTSINTCMSGKYGEWPSFRHILMTIPICSGFMSFK